MRQELRRDSKELAYGEFPQSGACPMQRLTQIARLSRFHYRHLRYDPRYFFWNARALARPSAVKSTDFDR